MAQKRTPWEQEWALLHKQERSYYTKHKEYQPSFLDRMLEDKVPKKLRATLDSAFVKAFSLVFEKGSPLLERTYSPAEVARQYQEDAFSADLRGNRKSLRAFSRRSGRTESANLALSGVEGVALGALGVGIPDIPVFTALLLRSLYQMAGRFGFPHDTKEEQYFQLLLIQGAFSYGEALEGCVRTIDRFIEHPALPEDFDLQKQIRLTAETLSSQLLYMKFLQGIPIVGVVGGASDVTCLHRVQSFARLKYRRRLLVGRRDIK